MKKHLEEVVNAIVTQDPAAGEKAFHQYIRAKSQQILLGEKHEEDESEEDEDEDESEEKDEDESEEKEDKKPAFVKKGKKKSAKKED